MTEKQEQKVHHPIFARLYAKTSSAAEEGSVLRRQAKTPRYRAADRALLAALSRALPRKRWSAFAVRPETLLRWHRVIVKHRWTYARRAPGRPPLDAACVALGSQAAR